MKAVIQRVNRASLRVNDQLVSKISKGEVVLLGVASEDSQKDVEIMVEKLKNIRIFSDKEGKTNLSIKDIDGEMLLVSQFTLLADLDKGRRPSFMNAARPDHANELYIKVIDSLKNDGIKVATGVFKEHMQIELENDGPVTFVFDTKRDS